MRHCVILGLVTEGQRQERLNIKARTHGSFGGSRECDRVRICEAVNTFLNSSNASGRIEYNCLSIYTLC